MTELDELVDETTAQVPALPDAITTLQSAMRACKCRSCTWALANLDASQWLLWTEESEEVTA